MAKYIKLANNINRDADNLRVSLEYEKGRGYAAHVSPCKVTDHSYSTLFGAEYFNFYSDVSTMLVTAGRRNTAKELAAADMMAERMDEIVENYIKTVEQRGGVPVVIADKEAA